MTLPPSLRALALLLLTCAGDAHSGDWSAEMPGGLRVAVVQDAARTRDGYLLERRYPDGRPDAQFGDDGSVVFMLGPDNAGPAALRLDAQGRAWIASASQGTDGRLQAVLLRFRPDGRPDGSFGTQGRSATAPAGREARATDVLPLEDGSAWVAGVVVDGQGAERSGLWRIGADGRIDPRFGLGGLWTDNGAGEADVGGLERGPDGELALGLRRAEGGRGVLELWTWRADSMPQRRAAEAVEPARLDTARLVRRDGQWAWSGGARAPAPPPRTAAGATVKSAAATAEPPGPALALPFAGASAPATDVAPAPQAGASGGTSAAWLLLPAAGMLAWWGWRRLRRPPV